jgi:8-oxo-dGTP pyrophosphatase MutT (NUDIX family)
MTQRRVAKTISSAFVIYRGAILLLRRAKPYAEVPLGTGTWELPGGAIDFGESPETALRRELGEELRLAVSRRTPLRVIDTCGYVLETRSVRSHRVHLIYMLSLRRKPMIRLSPEHDASRFVSSVARAQTLIAIPEIKGVVTRELARRTKAGRRG